MSSVSRVMDGPAPVQVVYGEEQIGLLADHGRCRRHQHETSSPATRGSNLPSPLSRITTCRVPVSITALSGTATTGACGSGRELHVGVHRGTQNSVRVGQLDADAGRPGLHGQVRIDPGDGPR